PASGADPLHLAGADHTGVPGPVGVPDPAGEHPGHDLHIAVVVDLEALAGADDVVVVDQQRAEGAGGQIEGAGGGEGLARIHRAVAPPVTLGRPHHRDCREAVGHGDPVCAGGGHDQPASLPATDSTRVTRWSSAATVASSSAFWFSGPV